MWNLLESATAMRVPILSEVEGWDTATLNTLVIPTGAKRSGEPALSLSKGICCLPAAPQISKKT
jgi:hypothetical protein